jgi:hypothetical protein
MQELRERGIYTLPDGREFVVHTAFRGGHILYTPSGWEFFGPSTYNTGADGIICSNSRTTHWNIRDLTDTGKTARSRTRGGAAQKSVWD